ncbi:MAG: cellulase family glycosylhydrolase [Lentisphaeria bacterium]|nr:MAG: cellulase family glycosylhydrolase [Lentisphaeria bacterium]
MSPHKFTEEDFRTLKAWNVNLVRAQITRRWGQFDTDQDLEEYDRWFDGKLAHLEQALQWAGKYGIKMIFDMHTPPGGRNRQREMTMFFKKEIRRSLHPVLGTRGEALQGQSRRSGGMTCSMSRFSSGGRRTTTGTFSAWRRRRSAESIPTRSSSWNRTCGRRRRPFSIFLR